MKVKLVKENVSDFLKPKSKEELGDEYHEMKRKTDEFMTKIFSDLYKDPKNQNLYRNSKDMWMFDHDLKRGYIYVSYHRVWLYFYKNITHNFNIIKMLIEEWLRENTDWPQLPTFKGFFKSIYRLKENTDWPQLPVWDLL